MERFFMAFGSGKRTCIGKNISLLEVYKLVPLLLSKFNVRPLCRFRYCFANKLSSLS
jgi:hypothetical protein